MLFEALKKLFCSDSSGENKSGSAKERPVCRCEEKTGEPVRGVKLGDLEDFVSYVVKNLVDAPGDVKVETVIENGTKTIRISCRKDDTGKIIGKKGKTIIALRALVAGAAGRMQDRVSVEVAD